MLTCAPSDPLIRRQTTCFVSDNTMSSGHVISPGTSLPLAVTPPLHRPSSVTTATRGGEWGDAARMRSVNTSKGLFWVLSLLSETIYREGFGFICVAIKNKSSLCCVLCNLSQQKTSLLAGMFALTAETG